VRLRLEKRLERARISVIRFAMEQQLRLGDLGGAIVGKLGAFLIGACSSCEGLSFLITPVNSSKQASAFSKSESITSTTPRQLSSTESPSLSVGPVTSVPAVAALITAEVRAMMRALCSSSDSENSALEVRWKFRSSDESCPTVRVTCTRAEVNLSWNGANSAESMLTSRAPVHWIWRKEE
jgi:hypothetical protein